MPESDKDNKEILEFQNIGKDHDHYEISPHTRQDGYHQ